MSAIYFPTVLTPYPYYLNDIITYYDHELLKTTGKARIMFNDLLLIERYIMSNRNTLKMIRRLTSYGKKDNTVHKYWTESFREVVREEICKNLKLPGTKVPKVTVNRTGLIKMVKTK